MGRGGDSKHLKIFNQRPKNGRKKTLRIQLTASSDKTYHFMNGKEGQDDGNEAYRNTKVPKWRG